MDDYLLRMKAVTKNPHVTKGLVVANFECDFDTTLASFSLAMYMNNNRPQNDPIQYYLPIINKDRKDLEKLSVLLQYFKRLRVTPKHLICKDELKLDMFNKYVLVDYQKQWFYMDVDESLVRLVFDNILGQLEFTPSPGCVFIYKHCCSIAAVVLDYILKKKPQNLHDDEKLSLTILYDAIYYKMHSVGKSTDLEPLFKTRNKYLPSVPDDYWLDLYEYLTLFRYSIEDAKNETLLAKCFFLSVNDVSLFYFPISLKVVKDKCSQEDFFNYALKRKTKVFMFTGSQVDAENNEIQEICVINLANQKLTDSIMKKVMEKINGLQVIADTSRNWKNWFECKIFMPNLNARVLELLQKINQ